MAPAHELKITGWPALPLPLPVYVRWRFRLEEERGAILAEPVPGVVASAGGDTCLRLAELGLDDAEGGVSFLNDVGAQLDVTAVEHPWTYFEDVANTVRHAVVAWRLLAGDPPPGETELRATPFAGHPSTVEHDAADFLGVMLAQKLRPLHPTVWLALGTGESPIAAARDVSLEALCFLELHNHVVRGAPYRRCRNEACGRLFAAEPGSSRRSLYCSRAHAHAQAQREFRRRRARASQ